MTKKEVVIVRMTAEQKKALRDQSKKVGATMSGFLAGLVQKYLVGKK